MSKKTLSLLAILLVAGLPAVAQVDTGSADFTRYVAFGDSLTAGFASGGLALENQRTSYPALIFAQVNGTAAGFEQPIVSDPGIPAQLFLQSLVPLRIGQKPGIGNPVNLTVEVLQLIIRRMDGMAHQQPGRQQNREITMHRSQSIKSLWSLTPVNRNQAIRTESSFSVNVQHFPIPSSAISIKL